MGLLKGNKLSGLIGPLVVRDSGKKGVSIVQAAPREMNQTEGTKMAGKLFGVASALAGVLRRDLTRLIDKFYDPGMINRLNSPVKAVIMQCYDKETGTFSFEADSFQRLVGFEFNIKSLLIDSLLVHPVTTLTGNVMTVALPEFQVPAKLKFPFTANKCTLVVAVSQIALEHDMHNRAMEQSIEIDSQGTVPATEFSFEVGAGCLCVAGIGLKFAKVTDQVRTPINSKTFNPAGICAAVVTGGEFVAPVILNSSGGNISPWRELGKLGLMKKEQSEI